MFKVEEHERFCKRCFYQSYPKVIYDIDECHRDEFGSLMCPYNHYVKSLGKRMRVIVDARGDISEDEI